jgi:c-di-GMP-related signal transduction protein
MSTPAAAVAVALEKRSPCIARQPILTADEEVVGYELFFREAAEDRQFSSDRENATSAIIEALNMVGLEVLCAGQVAFINCTHQMLLTDYFALLPPKDVVIEIQETVPANEEVALACARLKSNGYSIALDNFVPEDSRASLVPYADFIKIDISKVLPWQSTELIGLYGSEHCRMLAQKVETRPQFMTARHNGFTRFQGYFFRRPENLRVRQIPASQTTYLRLQSAVAKSDVDFNEIEDLVKHEPSLCYRLLRYLNSPLIGLSLPVLSIRHALNLLGEEESVRWIRMATTLVPGQDKLSDLVLAALVRARFCELIAPRIEPARSDLFLMGMLSLMDAILSVPIGMVIEKLCLDPEISAQLLCAKTGGQTALSPVYDLMVAREAGDWERVTRLGKKLKLSLSFVAETSNEAMRWAHQATTPVGHPRQS